MIDRYIQNIFKKRKQVLYGYANIEYSKFKDTYSCALVFAVPYIPQLYVENYSEQKFEQSINSAKNIIDEILKDLKTVLNNNYIDYYIPPTSQTNETELIAPFSFKYAAVNAGLGWIGKNDTLITRQYGPRIRLSSILLDARIKTGTPITKSSCPQNCNACVNICPSKALKNTNWDINKKRSEIIDYHLCNQKRSLYIEKYGRKNSCGLCMIVCPFGRDIITK